MRALIEMVAPLRCVGCASEGDELCPACARDVRVVSRPWCTRCGTPTAGGANTHSCPRCSDLEGFARARSLVFFAEPARGLTLQLKRRGRRPLATAVGELLGLLVLREDIAGADTSVAWVPGGRRARRAGFDHAALMATALARSLGVRARPLLVRAADGPRQSDVPLARRRANVAERFVANDVRGHVLVVDDVFTTGATAEACAIALRRAGADRVDVVTWARTRRLRPG